MIPTDHEHLGRPQADRNPPLPPATTEVHVYLSAIGRRGGRRTSAAKRAAAKAGGLARAAQLKSNVSKH